MGHTEVKYGGLIILSRKFKSFPIHHLSGCKSMVDGHIWDVEAGGSNPLTQAIMPRLTRFSVLGEEITIPPYLLGKLTKEKEGLLLNCHSTGYRL